MRKKGTVISHVRIETSTRTVEKVPVRLLRTSETGFVYRIEIDEPAKVCVEESLPCLRS